MPRTISLVGARGGQGTSTVTAAFAGLAASAQRTCITSHDPIGMAHLLGSRVPLPGDPQPVATRLRHIHPTETTIGPGDELVVIDAGTIASARTDGDGDARYAVVRGPCYLSLATLVAETDLPFDGIVLVAEEGRSLSTRDVVEIAGLPVVATVPVHPRISQSVDAGVLVTGGLRLPEWAQLRSVVAVQLSLHRLAPERLPGRAATPEPPAYEVGR